mmetsp:Transcript_91101/g.244297  ORF Transcript_91101/g.244297 Transcript_91101/m.244297 type:complete len:201 (-) Transcript_91101:79-681(-)
MAGEKLYISGSTISCQLMPPVDASYRESIVDCSEPKCSMSATSSTAGPRPSLRKSATSCVRKTAKTNVNRVSSATVHASDTNESDTDTTIVLRSAKMTNSLASLFTRMSLVTRKTRRMPRLFAPQKATAPEWSSEASLKTWSTTTRPSRMFAQPCSPSRRKKSTPSAAMRRQSSTANRQMKPLSARLHAQSGCRLASCSV